MWRRRAVTLALVAAGMATQQLPMSADAAPTRNGPGAVTNDFPAVPRLLRTARVQASVPAPCFTRSVALSADGHTAVLACSLDGAASTSVVVLSDAFPGGTWRVTGRMTGPSFVSIALAGDGRTLAIRYAFYRQTWVYTRDGRGWRRTGAIGGSDYGENSFVVLSGDGGTLAMTVDSRARGRQDVQVFLRTPAGWSQQATIRSPVPARFFGAAIALRSSGDAIVIGAPDAYGKRGAVFVYRRVGGRWRLSSALHPANSRGFGDEIAASADGGTVGVGDDDGISVFAARGRRFVRTGHFGGLPTLVLSADGHTLLVGNPMRRLHGVTQAGRVYRFVDTQSGWRFGGVLDPPAGDAGYGELGAVAVDARGRRVLVAPTWPSGWESARVVSADVYDARPGSRHSKTLRTPAAPARPGTTSHPMRASGSGVATLPGLRGTLSHRS